MRASDLARAAGAAVREAVLDAWAVVQPVECLGCGRPDRSLCADCSPALAPGRPWPVRCAAPVGAPVWAAADYEGPVRGAILALKNDGRTDAARPLARLVTAALGAALAGATPGIELAPVPSRAAALRRRGLDPVRELLLAARLPASRVLVARRSALPQKALDRAGRLAAQGRFRARRQLDGRRFVLVDDVVTTGATLADCAAAIRAAGGAVVAAVAACAPDWDSRGRLGSDR